MHSNRCTTNQWLTEQLPQRQHLADGHVISALWSPEDWPPVKLPLTVLAQAMATRLNYRSFRTRNVFLEMGNCDVNSQTNA